MTKTKPTFTPGDQVFCPADGINGTVRAVYTAFDWGEVIDVMSSEGKVIYASPIKNWKVRIFLSRKPYWTCPDCGSNLDHGERCDCKKCRLVVTINAKNRFEAMSALDILLEKIKGLPYDSPIKECVIITNEGLNS